MANTSSKQIVADGYRNAVVNLVGTLDTADVNIVPAVTLADFTNNDPAYGPLVGLRVDSINYTSGPDLVTTLEWNAVTPQLIAAMAQSETLKYKHHGGLKPNTSQPGYNGSINLRTRGYTVGTTEGYTVILRLVKIYTE